MTKIIHGALAGLFLIGGAGLSRAADAFGGDAGRRQVSDWGPIDSELTNRVQRVFSVQPSPDAAREVRVAARNGKVTLMGFVPTEADREALVREAEAVAGEGNVVNQLTIARR